MREAANALRQASRQLAGRGQPDKPSADAPGQTGATDSGSPDPSALDPDLKKYAGKPWGELPGELRTKVLQDLKARYGEDYARRIKLYFEQIADTKKR